MCVRKYTLCAHASAQIFWHERAAFQRLAFRWSTAGNDVVATVFINPPPPPLPRFSSPLRPFLIEGVLGSKNFFSGS